jgi:hypothetical protein
LLYAAAFSVKQLRDTGCCRTREEVQASADYKTAGDFSLRAHHMALRRFARNDVLLFDLLREVIRKKKAAEAAFESI